MLEESQVGPLSPKQVLELEHALSLGIIPSGISSKAAQEWIGRPKDTKKIVAGILKLGPDMTLHFLGFCEAGLKPLSRREELKRICEIRIEDLDFSVRASNMLIREGIQTVADLIKLTRKDILEIRNSGQRPLVEIEERLSRFGLHLRGRRMRRKRD